MAKLGVYLKIQKKFPLYFRTDHEHEHMSLWANKKLDLTKYCIILAKLPMFIFLKCPEFLK